MHNCFCLAQKCLSQEIPRLSASFLLATALVVLAGCGSGSAPSPGAASGSTGTSGGSTTGSTGTSTTATGTTAATIQLLVSSPQIASTGSTTVDLTAVVLDANKQTLQGRKVTFSPGTDPTAYISDVVGTSDTNGVATAKLNVGTNKANRTISITTTADAATATSNVDVIGTSIAVAGNNSISLGATSTFTYTLRDSAGSPVQGVALTVASKTGNAIAMTPATGVTNSSGQISAVITANSSGNDVITVSGGGANTTHALAVSTASLTFSAPASTDLPLAPPTTVTVTWSDAGVPQVGKQVTFASSRGSITGNPATTDATGSASVTVSSPSTSGPAVISASGPGGTPSASVNVAFTATTANLITVQAIPNVIQVAGASTSQSTNISTITAIVRDSIGNVVKNAGVNFGIVTDISGGSLSAARVITDAFGSASVNYTAGNLSSPQGGVVISATVTDVNGAVPSPAVAGIAKLTVAGPTLFVRLGTSNIFQSSSPSSLLYVMQYIAIVTDSAGHPVPGAVVRFQLRPGNFRKGTYTLGDPAVVNSSGVITIPAIPGKVFIGVTCLNEDTDFSGLFTASKDTNGNGQLDPGGIASVSPSETTDSSGVATATITYPKDHAIWVQVSLEARTGVAGDDPPATSTFYLPGTVDKIYSLSASPDLAGILSPYGIDAVCTDTK